MSADNAGPDGIPVDVVAVVDWAPENKWSVRRVGVGPASTADDAVTAMRAAVIPEGRELHWSDAGAHRFFGRRPVRQS